MSLKEEQDLLARLYTDPDFRERMLSGNDSADPRTRDLASAAADEVKWFAESLVTKRLREVEKLLPLIRNEIGAKEFEAMFRAFAPSFNPSSVKKHLEDAVEFAQYLQAGRRVDSFTGILARFESARLRHIVFSKTLSVCSLRVDPRSEGVRGIGFWLAIGSWSRIFFRPGRR